MARLYDSGGNLLGGLNGDTKETRLLGHTGATPEAATAPDDPLLPQPPVTPLNPNYGPEETVPGLECSYGTLASSRFLLPSDNARRHSRLLGCHNPVEKSSERFHCAVCGGDYCCIHADRPAHDCDNLTLSENRGRQSRRRR